MPRHWPEQFPAALVDGYSTTPLDQVRRSEIEGGIQAQRRFGWERIDRTEVSWRMNDDQYGSFRRWFRDTGGWSIAGDSNVFSTWTRTNLTVSSSAVADPPGTSSSAWRFTEVATTATFYADRSWTSTPADNSVMVATISARAGGLGRNLQWLIIPKTGVVAGGTVTLTTGTVTSLTGSPISVTCTPRGDGWYRLVCTANIGTGGTAPRARVRFLSGASGTYAGSTDAYVDLSEMNVRGRSSVGDLYLPTDASGNITGAAGGAAWFRIPLSFGGPIKTLEARFASPYGATYQPGGVWEVSASLDVRYI